MDSEKSNLASTQDDYFKIIINYKYSEWIQMYKNMNKCCDTFFSATHETFSKTEQILGHKKNLNK